MGLTGVRIGALIIGDELLTGRRQDQHLPALIEILAKRGLELAWVRILGDDPALLTQTLQQTFATDDIVLSFGGIGATPDDRTRQCCAKALAVPLQRHIDAQQAMQHHFGDRADEQRLRMVDFPQGAAMIPNPVNKVAGFSIKDHHFVPGFPSMAWPMIEWVMDTYYVHIQQPGHIEQRTMRVIGAREGDLIPLLERLQGAYPQLRISCLPSASAQGCGFEVELGVRGPNPLVAQAFAQLTDMLAENGYNWE
ncbi:competence/damage-inducible protein A [Halorhodospira halochloris]|uniref:competence/damage-inducible protein A n=1 Tax=Halorhodospira halochloris TaxID=1052 RepID=UPI001EE99180|nr:competence/damage-inducible protein A [Halorhodospira halochloris]